MEAAARENESFTTSFPGTEMLSLDAQGTRKPKRASASSASPEARQPGSSSPSASHNSRVKQPTAAIASPHGAALQSQLPATSKSKASAKRRRSASADSDSARKLPKSAVPDLSRSYPAIGDLPREPRKRPATAAAAAAAAAPGTGGQRQASSSLESTDTRKKRRKTLAAAVDARHGGGRQASAALRAAEDSQHFQAEQQAGHLGGTSISQQDQGTGQLAGASNLQQAEEFVPEDGRLGHSRQQGSQLSKRDKRLGTAQQSAKVDKQATANQNGKLQLRPLYILSWQFRNFQLLFITKGLLRVRCNKEHVAVACPEEAIA